ncbi:hypothetical protein ABID82_004271 [Methylobacterium sp. PvP062]|uniref:Uncharacterized protein n=1 Tax=Methylobacterium radiotolerans TaxID=31998 RepID=A0ABV2NL59_9HYPH|nr:MULTISPECIES: hypothetical protein [unclassified Methylobacterium]KZC01435.1 hypothetical protein AU375_02359 [Methylobacterium radiotolerans]MBP2496033.1 hypothetical protein [Methylobacterium sp. PvP105]MBP2504096.1 hypothetical protein [Methylobacterium sp. PvP109]MCX7333113.1 hypothetical protein [Hyphomicrobiales bacterium]
MRQEFRWFLIEVAPGPCVVQRDEGYYDHKVLSSAIATVGTMSGQRQRIEVHDSMDCDGTDRAESVNSLVTLLLASAREAAKAFIEAANAALEDAPSDRLPVITVEVASPEGKPNFDSLKRAIEHALETGEMAAPARQA